MSGIKRFVHIKTPLISAGDSAVIHSFSRYGHGCPGGGYELRDSILLPHNQEWSIRDECHGTEGKRLISLSCKILLCPVHPIYIGRSTNSERVAKLVQPLRLNKSINSPIQPSQTSAFRLRMPPLVWQAFLSIHRSLRVRR